MTDTDSKTARQQDRKVKIDNFKTRGFPEKSHKQKINAMGEK